VDESHILLAARRTPDPTDPRPQRDCTCLLLKAPLRIGTGDFIFPPFQDCLTLGWPELLARQRGVLTHLQKCTGFVAGSSANSAPQPNVKNCPSAVVTSHQPPLGEPRDLLWRSCSM